MHIYLHYKELMNCCNIACPLAIIDIVSGLFNMFTSASFDFPPASTCFIATATPGAVAAPLPGEVASAASAAGASYICIRPSSRSFSNWVAVVYFVSSATASKFASALSQRCEFPFCVVRSVGEWQAVSVPIEVSEFESGAGLPCLYMSF